MAVVVRWSSLEHVDRYVDDGHAYFAVRTGGAGAHEEAELEDGVARGSRSFAKTVAS